MKDRGVMCVKDSKSSIKELSEQEGQSWDSFMQGEGV